MRREIQDIRTRFSVVGLDGVQAAFRATGQVLTQVTSMARGTSGAAAAAANDAAASAARAGDEQVSAARRAGIEQTRLAREQLRQQQATNRAVAAERTRAAREAAAQAQRDAETAAAAATANPGSASARDAARAANAVSRQRATELAEAQRQASAAQAIADREARTRAANQVRAARQASREAVAIAEAQARATAQAGDQAARDATARAAAERRTQLEAAKQAAAEQLRIARQAAAQASALASQQAAERQRIAREAAEQAQRDASAAAAAARAQTGPTAGMDPAQAAAARAAQDQARAAARAAADLAAQRTREAAEQVRRDRAAQAQADRDARARIRAAEQAARAAAAAAAAQARIDAANAAERMRLLRQEQAARAAQLRADQAAQAAAVRAAGEAARARIRELQQIARQQAQADRQRQADLRAQEAADRAAAAAAIAAAQAATGAARAAARQAARDALERLRQTRQLAAQEAAAAAERQRQLAELAAREASIQRDRERRSREQARRDQQDLRDRTRAETEAARALDRARRDAERAARDAARNERRDADDRARSEGDVADQVRETTGEIERQEREAGKLAKAFRAVGKAVGSVGRLAIGGAKAGAAGALVAGSLGAAAAGGTFLLAKSQTEKASEYVRTTYDASRSVGLDPNTFTALMSKAREYGLEIDDLRGTLIGLQGVIADSGRAGAGDPIFDQLKSVGVDISPVNGKLKTTGELLLPILRGLERLDGTTKIGLMGKLFGEDDAGRLIPLFADLLDDTELLAKERVRQAKLGDYISPRDLAVARQYRIATADVESAWRGVSLEIANALGPNVSELMRGFAYGLGNQRREIAAILDIWVRSTAQFFQFQKLVGNLDFGRLVPDLLGMAQFGKAFDGQVANKWMLSVRNAFSLVITAAGTAMRFVREVIAAVFNDRMAVREWPWLLTLRDGVAKGLVTIQTFAQSAWWTVTMQDYNVPTEYGWMIALRNSVLGYVQGIVRDVKAVWADLSAVWDAGGEGAQPATGPGRMLAGLLGGFEEARKYLLSWQRWFRDLGNDISVIWDQIGNPNKDKSGFKFDWMRDLSNGIWFVADAAKQGWEWFRGFYQTIFDFVERYTGLNFESILFFVAFLKFTGTLAALKVALGLVLSPLKWLAGFLGAGAAAAAAGGGAAGAAVTALGTALTGLLTTLGAIATSPVWLAIMGGVAGGVGLASALKDTWVGERIRDLAGYMNDEGDSPGLKAIRAAGENPTEDERFRAQVRVGNRSFSEIDQWRVEEAAKKAASEASAAQFARQQAAMPDWTKARFDSLDGSFMPSAQDQRPTNNVTIVLPTGDSIEARQTGSQYDDTMRKLGRR